MAECLEPGDVKTLTESNVPPKYVLKVSAISPIEVIKKVIRELEKKFNSLKSRIRKYLESSKVLLAEVADVLLSLSPDDDEYHKFFLERHIKDLASVANYTELFMIMNFHWNYYDPSLLECLVREFGMKELMHLMKAYNSDLTWLRKNTPLMLYCHTQRRRRKRIPPGFTKILAKFPFPAPMLEDVEQFRQEFASEYSPREFAMMLAEFLQDSFATSTPEFLPELYYESFLSRKSDQVSGGLPPEGYDTFSLVKHPPAENKIDVVSNNDISITTKVSFIYTGEKMEFLWKDAGINLYFPAADCEKSEIKISVEVLGNIDDETIFPKCYRFLSSASATYRITSTGPLPAPVRVRIEHCAVIENEDSLALLVAREDSPYRFTPVPDAEITLKSSYAEFQVEKFSIFRFFKRRRSLLRLAIQLFYHDNNTATFIVTKDLAAHLSAVKDEMKKDPLLRKVMYCDCSSDPVALSIPLESKGWQISSEFEPAEIQALAIKEYEPGQTPPNIPITMNWIGNEQPKEEKVCINITAKQGDVESFQLSCKPQPHLGSQYQSQAVSDAATLPSETPQYKAVSNSYDNLHETLESTDGAVPTLRTKFVSVSWLSPTTKAEADELLRKALVQIKNNVGSYEVFVRMLKEIAGLQDVVKRITENFEQNKQ